MLERVGLAGWSLRNWLEFKSLKGRLAHEMTMVVMMVAMLLMAKLVESMTKMVLG